MRRKNESGVMMVCVLLLIFYMIKKGITLCCFKSVVVLLLLKKKIFKEKLMMSVWNFWPFHFSWELSLIPMCMEELFPVEQFLLWQGKIENSSTAQKKWMTSSYPMMSKIGHSSCLFGPYKSGHFIGTF